jgi:hypothetical protein
MVCGLLEREFTGAASWQLLISLERMWLIDMAHSYGGELQALRNFWTNYGFKVL